MNSLNEKGFDFWTGLVWEKGRLLVPSGKVLTMSWSNQFGQTRKREYGDLSFDSKAALTSSSITKARQALSAPAYASGGRCGEHVNHYGELVIQKYSGPWSTRSRVWQC
jgi:hypothetical protein